MYFHKAVLLKEAIEYLNPRPGQNFIDCTLGAGGHALAVLEKTRPGGSVLGIDLSEEAIAEVAKKYEASGKKEPDGGKLILVRDNFGNLGRIAEKYISGVPVSGILFDLGLSSALLESSGRGFSFLRDEPLDMRFDDKQKLTAEDVVNEWPEKELARIFREYGGETHARRIAWEICRARKIQKIDSSGQLADLVKRATPKGKKYLKHPATRVFQAVRIAVNRELEILEEALPQALRILQPGGRIAVISFHSLEDRIAKRFFAEEAKDCVCPPEFPVCRCDHRARLKIITRKAVVPSEEEIAENPRARSAQLRVAEKIT